MPDRHLQMAQGYLNQSRQLLGSARNSSRLYMHMRGAADPVIERQERMAIQAAKKAKEQIDKFIELVHGENVEIDDGSF